MKPLILALLLASPPAAVWMLRGEKTPVKDEAIQLISTARNAPAGESVQVPVEVVTKGGKPQWVYVEVSTQAVPEPGVITLAALTSLLLFRRQRVAGK